MKRSKPDFDEGAEADESVGLMNMDDYILACVLAAAAADDPKDAARLGATCRRLWAVSQRRDVWEHAALWRLGEDLRLPQHIRSARDSVVVRASYSAESFGKLAPKVRARTQKLVLSNGPPPQLFSDEDGGEDEDKELAPLWPGFLSLRSLVVESVFSGLASTTEVWAAETLENIVFLEDSFGNFSAAFLSRDRVLPNIRSVSVSSPWDLSRSCFEALAFVFPNLRKISLNFTGQGSVSAELAMVLTRVPFLEDVEIDFCHNEEGLRGDLSCLAKAPCRERLRRVSLNMSRDVEADLEGQFESDFANPFDCALVARACPNLEVLLLGEAYDAALNIEGLSQLRKLHTIGLPLRIPREAFEDHVPPSWTYDCPKVREEFARRTEQDTEEIDLDGLTEKEEDIFKEVAKKVQEEELDAFLARQCAALSKVGMAADSVSFRSIALFNNSPKFKLERFFGSPRCACLERLELSTISLSDAESICRSAASSTLHRVSIRARFSSPLALLLSRCSRIEHLELHPFSLFGDAEVKAEAARGFQPFKSKVRSLVLTKTKNDDTTLVAVATLFGEMLEEFSCQGFRAKYTESGLATFLQACPQLRILKLAWPQTVAIPNVPPTLRFEPFS